MCEKTRDWVTHTVRRAVGTTSKPVRIASKLVCINSRPVRIASKLVCMTSKPACITSKPVRITSMPVRITSKPMCRDSKPVDPVTSENREESASRTVCVRARASIQGLVCEAKFEV